MSALYYINTSYNLILVHIIILYLALTELTSLQQRRNDQNEADRYEVREPDLPNAPVDPNALKAVDRHDDHLVSEQSEVRDVHVEPRLELGLNLPALDQVQAALVSGGDRKLVGADDQRERLLHNYRLLVSELQRCRVVRALHCNQLALLFLVICATFCGEEFAAFFLARFQNCKFIVRNVNQLVANFKHNC